MLTKLAQRRVARRLIEEHGGEALDLATKLRLHCERTAELTAAGFWAKVQVTISKLQGKPAPDTIH